MYSHKKMVSEVGLVDIQNQADYKPVNQKTAEQPSRIVSKGL